MVVVFVCTYLLVHLCLEMDEFGLFGQSFCSKILKVVCTQYIAMTMVEVGTTIQS